MKKTKRFHAIKNTLLGFISLGFIATGIFLVWASAIDLPSFDAFHERKVSESTKIYDRSGKILLYDIHQNIKRTVVPFDEISRYAKNAAVAIEDAEFYQHHGIKPTAVVRAALVNIISGSYSQGGSTITQQVIKNALLTPEKTITRKLKEWILSIKLEQVMPKEQILALYLNEAPYGGNIYGIQEAARAFFGKDARELGLAESAYLAALPQAPTYYSPYGNHRDKLEERKTLVLERMKELGFVSSEEYEKAREEEVAFLPQETFGIKAPHFVLWVRQYLEQKYGKQVVENGGYKVVTTLDYDLQRTAEDIVARYAEENEKKFNASNAGMVGVDPKTGHVLVMVGSRDYFDVSREGNFNVALARRQPGSAFKPFVYATAFKKGYTPETAVFDLKTQFQTTCDSEGNPLYEHVDPEECYMPDNYDHVFRGPVTLREALAQSINIPAIKTLYLSGIRESLKTAQDMGITTLADANRYGLTLVLGGGEVSLLEMTSAYSVFANDGRRNPYTAILRIENKDGKVIEEFAHREQQVLEENIARQISDILSDNEARAPAFGERSPLYFDDMEVASKTGTTNDYRDAWIIGYTPSFALGAWVGNNDNSSMEKKVAGFVVAPMWHEFMERALERFPEAEFGQPKPVREDIKPVLRGIWRGNKVYYVDSISGKIATEYTPRETRQERVVGDVHTILHWVKKADPLGPIPEHPEKDPQFHLWEKGVRRWVDAYNIKEGGEMPTEIGYDDVHTPALAPDVDIINPDSGKRFGPNKRVIVSLAASGSFPLARADFFVNGVFVGSSQTPPFSFSFIPSELGVVEKYNVLRVVVYDVMLNKTVESREFLFETERTEGG